MKKMIRRFNIETNEDTKQLCLQENENGSFVLYTDYLILEGEATSLKRENGEIRTHCYLTGGMD